MVDEPSRLTYKTMSKFFNERKNKKKMFQQMHEEVVRLYLRVSIRVKLVLL